MKTRIYAAPAVKGLILSFRVCRRPNIEPTLAERVMYPAVSYTQQKRAFAPKLDKSWASFNDAGPNINSSIGWTSRVWCAPQPWTTHWPRHQNHTKLVRGLFEDVSLN